MRTVPVVPENGDSLLQPDKTHCPKGYRPATGHTDSPSSTEGKAQGKTSARKPPKWETSRASAW